jgi:transposase-like protein
MAKGLNGAKRDEWRRRLAKFDSSGLTVVDFCRREQVSQASFYYWSKRVQESDRRATHGLPRVDVGTASTRNEEGSDCVEVFVDNSIRVRMPAGDPAAVAALVNQLRRAQRADASATTSRFQRIELT